MEEEKVLTAGILGLLGATKGAHEELVSLYRSVGPSAVLVPYESV